MNNARNPTTEQAPYQHRTQKVAWVLVLVTSLLAVSAIILSTFAYRDNTKLESKAAGTNTAYAAVRVATTQPIIHGSHNTKMKRSLSLQTNAMTIDGVLLVKGDMVLVKDELDAKNNGLYIVTQNEAGEAMYERAPSMDTAQKIVPGNQVTVLEGTVNKGQTFTVFQNSGSNEDTVTGAGITFKNTATQLLGLNSTQGVPDGHVLFRDSSQGSQVKWASPNLKTKTEVTVGSGLVKDTNATNGDTTVELEPMVAASVMGNSENTKATPQAVVIERGSLLTKNGETLTAFNVGEANRVLGVDGTNLAWTSVTGTGTVTAVNTGPGLTGGPITDSGTVSLIDYKHQEDQQFFFPKVTLSTQGLVTDIEEYEWQPGQLMSSLNDTPTSTTGGTVGQVLTYQGSNAVPTWTTKNSGTVTSIDTGTGLTGGPITDTGTVALANTSVTPASYQLANVTVDAQGRLTAASNYALAGGQVISSADGTLTNTSGGLPGQILTYQGAATKPTWTAYTGSSANSITTSDGITGGPITDTGTVSLANLEAYSLLGNGETSSAPPHAVTLARGSLVTKNASDLQALPVGSNKSVLHSNGTDISWNGDTLNSTQVKATDSLLLPSYTTAQKLAIGTPLESEMVYDSDQKLMNVYTDTIWRPLFYTPYYLRIEAKNVGTTTTALPYPTEYVIPFTKVLENTAVCTTTLVNSLYLSGIPPGMYHMGGQIHLSINAISQSIRFLRFVVWEILENGDFKEPLFSYGGLVQRTEGITVYGGQHMSGVGRILAGSSILIKADIQTTGIYYPNNINVSMSFVHMGP